MKHALIISIALAATALPATADTVEIISATAQQDAGLWTLDVTLRHADTGWDHYADAWEVLAPDGTSLGVRELAHPHVEEQPFTRSLAGIAIPTGTTHVTIRARCLVDGWSGPTLQVVLGP